MAKIKLKIISLVSFDKESTRRVIDRLQYELEINNNEKQQVTMEKYHQWVSRRPNFGRLRYEYVTMLIADSLIPLNF